MQTIIHLNGHPVSLNFKAFEDEIDVDQLLQINYSNLYGEAVTIPVLMNTVGILKSDAEKVYSEKKLEFEVFEAELRKRLRKEATETSQKITENGLNELVTIDGGYKIKKKNMITAKYNLDVVENLWWAVKSKDMKLNNLVKGVTPQELFSELVDGSVNNILIKKHKSITEI